MGNSLTAGRTRRSSTTSDRLRRTRRRRGRRESECSSRPTTPPRARSSRNSSEFPRGATARANASAATPCRSAGELPCSPCPGLSS
eukprot:31427-Pelagococcus_subviridis.AAC.14